MARKGATRRSDLGRRSGEPTPAVGASARPPALVERALLATLALDAALSLALLYIHAQLKATRGAYTSFCNINEGVNCDAVLTSSYSSLLGVPIAAWALATYGVLAALLVWRARSTGATRERATLLLVGLATFSLVFSLYMAALAAFAVGALCVLCAGMYVLNLVVAVLAWRLVTAESGDASSPLGTRRVALGATVIAAALAIIGGAQLATTSPSLAHLSPDEIRARDPDFYRWYTTRPAAADLPPAEHVRGAPDAPVTIVEFSDFECTFCAKAFRDLREVERQHPGTIRVVFHHFPLDTACNPHVTGRMHRSACLAAIAAECAARHGRFWEYHDHLFGDQERLGRDDLISVAAELGIDRAAFTDCLDDPASRARVLEDANAGGRLRIKSTPTLFINGRTVEGALERPAYEYIIAMERRS